MQIPHLVLNNNHSLTLAQVNYCYVRLSVHYFFTLSDGTPEPYVCIQGNNIRIPGQWAYDDDTLMNYFNWDIGQPSGGPRALALGVNGKSLPLHDVPISLMDTCSYVCEIR